MTCDARGVIQASSMCPEAAIPLVRNRESAARQWALLCLPVLTVALVAGALQMGGPATAVALVAAALLLIPERVFYVWAWNRPQRFAAWCDRQGNAAPVDVLERACLLFKLLQASVIAGWFLWFGPGLTWPGSGGLVPTLAGGGLILVGQFLNYSVFRRLGRVGVFYGIRFGHPVPWCTAFPFSILKHPQYVGALLSIWGFFLVMRFPHDDWFLLPALETLYYTVGMRLEQ